MKFVEFEDMKYGKILINPDKVSSIKSINGGVVLIRYAGSQIELDYTGVNEDKALWYVMETLRLGYHPYADTNLNFRDNNWERNSTKNFKNEEMYLKEII